MLAPCFWGDEGQDREGERGGDRDGARAIDGGGGGSVVWSAVSHLVLEQVHEPLLVRLELEGEHLRVGRGQLLHELPQRGEVVHGDHG